MIHVLRHQIDKNGEFQGIDELFLRGDYFKGLTFERFDKHLEPDESLYSFYEREFGVEIVETSNFIAWDIGTEDLAKRLLAPKLANMPLISISVSRRPMGIFRSSAALSGEKRLTCSSRLISRDKRLRSTGSLTAERDRAEEEGENQMVPGEGLEPSRCLVGGF